MRLYLHGYQFTKQGIYQRIAEETLDYVIREMTDPAGGFYSAKKLTIEVKTRGRCRDRTGDFGEDGLVALTVAIGVGAGDVGRQRHVAEPCEQW